MSSSSYRACRRVVTSSLAKSASRISSRFLDLTGDVGSVSSSRVPEVCQCVYRHRVYRGDGRALGTSPDCRMDEHACHQPPLQFIRGRGFKNVWWPASLRPVQGNFLRQTVREKNCNSRSAQATGICFGLPGLCIRSTARLLPAGRARSLRRCCPVRRPFLPLVRSKVGSFLLFVNLKFPKSRCGSNLGVFRMKNVCFVVLAASCAPSLSACDICSVYSAAQAHGEIGKGFSAGVAEQFTHFGTLQGQGERARPADRRSSGSARSPHWTG